MDAELQFRVFRRGEERRAFRLENIFWGLLEQTAESRGQKVRELVFALADANPSCRNLSSLLRIEAANWVSDKATALAQISASEANAVLFQAAPAPGIIVGEDRRIIAYNMAMVRFLQARHSALENTEISGARFAFELPINQLIKFFTENPAKFMECGFRIIVGEETVMGRARVCLYRDAKMGDRRLGAFIIT